jgi:hypothetical protein
MATQDKPAEHSLTKKVGGGGGYLRENIISLKQTVRSKTSII